jgi:phospholipid/cholesterol/gamma-HCH transport system substrate-binding protein
MSRLTRLTTAAKVGVFAIVTVVAGIFIYSFASKSVSGSGYRVYALMADASGLAKHSHVRIAGIPVGSIDSVKLQAGQARIDILMNEDVKLFEDATVSRVSSSLLGEYFLAIAPGTEGRRQLKDGDRINLGKEAITTDELMRQVSAIATDVKKVTEALAESVGSDQGKGNLKLTLENLAQVTDALNQTVRENRNSLRNIFENVEQITSEGRPEIREILDNVRSSTDEVKALVSRAENGEAKDGEVRQIVDKVNRASSNLENTLKNLDDVSGRLERGEGTLGRLTKDEKLINEVEGVAETVNEFVGGISRLQTIVLLRTDYQFLASTVKSYVELRLQPREDKYYVIEVVNEPRGLTLYEQIDVDTTNPNDPPHYREIRTVTTNSFRFSLQFAQSFGPVTGRFGIKESTGGIGLDISLFENRFELRQDLFGFGEVVLPRYRLSLGYEFVRRFWLLGGVDDVFSGTRRDYFVGVALKFNDDDLKSVLPFAPSP